jgi:N-acetylated-alpha-linked acidic dipeptidase
MVYIMSSLARHSHLPIIPVVETKVTPIWNPIGVIPGHIKDEIVLVGNHRDGAC